MNYQKAYCVLFNAISDAIDQLNRSKMITQELDEGVNILKKHKKQPKKCIWTKNKCKAGNLIEKLDFLLFYTQNPKGGMCFHVS